MGRRVRFLLPAAVLVVATGAIPAQQVAARTDVTVEGATVTLTVSIDLVGAINKDGQEIGLKDESSGVATPISKYWGEAAKAWNDAFANLTYGGCVRLKLDLQFFPRPYGSLHTPGHHSVLIDPDPDVRPMVFDPATNVATDDSPSAFTSDLTGDWGAEEVGTISHEVGHLLGLGDDYTDVKDANGKVTGSKPVAGRENTMMASDGDVDQNIVDRLGKLVEKAGKRLPKCWTGTMTSSSTYNIDAPDGGPVCAARWTTKVTFVVVPEGKIDGTGDATLSQLGACPHPIEQGGFRQTQQIHTGISGTASADQLQVTYVALGPNVPADGVEGTGFSASIFGFGSPQPPLAIPIVSPGHAQGAQTLQLTSGSNVYTSDNTLDLTCTTC